MGCTGLRSALMAQAFVHKGAGAFVSWDRAVSVVETDRATQAMLERMAGGDAVAEAVDAAMAQTGPDPETDVRFTYYLR